MTLAEQPSRQIEKNTYNILFVCTGNTCRSPMAEAIMRHLVAVRGWARSLRAHPRSCTMGYVLGVPNRRGRQLGPTRRYNRCLPVPRRGQRRGG